MGGEGRCFVGDSKERGQLGQAVKGLSVAGHAVNKDVEDHGRERQRREGEPCALCLSELTSWDHWTWLIRLWVQVSACSARFHPGNGARGYEQKVRGPTLLLLEYRMLYTKLIMICYYWSPHKCLDLCVLFCRVFVGGGCQGFGFGLSDVFWIAFLMLRNICNPNSLNL